MNKSDAERLSSVMKSLGYKESDKEDDADIIFVLACSVRQSAIDRIYGKARKWNSLKKKRNIKTYLSGCVLPSDKKKMTKIFDAFFDVKDIVKLPKLLGNSDKCLEVSNYLKIIPNYTSSFSAFVPIMTGCNNFCTYCAVPYTKGREISRNLDDIVKEVESLVKKGYKEITLLGQNVNSYGLDFSESKQKKQNFANLLKSINKIPGKFWIMFITSNPHDMSEDIINAVATSEKIIEYIHLPVQAGNDQVLKNMNRKYTQKQYLDLVKKIKDKISNLAITTDTIVGFPGETKKQFEDTKTVYEKVKYDMAYIAQYSPRPGTVSAKMKDNVSRDEKKRRDKELNDILRRTALENNKKMIGSTYEVLFDKYKKGSVFGRTRTFKLVQAIGKKEFVGKFKKVKIESVTPWATKGIIV
ncbi:tRNA (N6-isopentenyl adenosine(37)-C2)-methylthiotransferase MiaB [bacterium]|nr:tRNA (N6-isopentenyl adenosine(37)-C2)-methylthiotransferase MiaB [bacterium]